MNSSPSCTLDNLNVQIFPIDKCEDGPVFAQTFSREVSPCAQYPNKSSGVVYLCVNSSELFDVGSAVFMIETNCEAPTGVFLTGIFTENNTLCEDPQ